MEPNLEDVSNEIVSASSSAAPTVDKTPKTSKGLLVATIIFAVIAIAGIAAAIYFFIDANDKATTNAGLRAKLDLVKMETGAELVEKEENGTTVTVVDTNSSTETRVKKLVLDLRDQLESAFNTSFYVTYKDADSPIRIPDTDTYTTSNQYYGVTSGEWQSIQNNPTLQAIFEGAHGVVVDYLTSHGFTKLIDYFASDVYGNSTTGIYCNVNTAQQYPFSVTCASDTWYDVENRDLIVALAKAAGVDFISASQSNIQDSTVTPYQRLMAGGVNYAALFYRVSPEANWQFFTGTQAELPCSEYTGDIAKAFAGDTCYDEATGQDSIVQP